MSSASTIEIVFPLGEPSSFQGAAIGKIREVLEKHGFGAEDFRLNVGAEKAYWKLFVFEGEEHVIAVYDDNVNMLQGPSLFECYMPEEFKSEWALIEGFATRLDRYLSGGPWEGPAEKGLPDLIKEKMNRLFRR